MTQSFRNPEEALAQIPRGTMFRVGLGTGGRSREVPNDEGKFEWTHDQLTDALKKNTIPDGTRLFLKPVEDGKVSRSSIKLDLSLAQESISVEQSPGVEQAQMQANPSYIQQEVLRALVGSYQDERDHTWELREENGKLRETIMELRIEVADLKRQLEDSSHEDSVGQVASKAIMEFAKGPGPLLFFQHLAKDNPQLAKPLADAIGQASKAS